MEYIYDAFISYRHLPADMAVAERLQKLLESRKKKDGKKLSIFRDKSDLPTTFDLGADIRTNLERSRFLIVICSPTYQESKWCMAELEHFRQFHGGNAHILPILVEGEPEEAFPKALRYDLRTVLDEQGKPATVWTEIEPLGADVRADTDAARLKKLRVEYLRVAAPILGVTFDQLYQRALRKKRAVTALVIAALAAFCVYSTILISQITQRQKQLVAKQQELYENESVRLANAAMELTGENLPLAMLLADTALPADLENPEYPLTAEAELAIRSAAMQHQLEEASAYFTQKVSIALPVSRWTVGAFYDHGNYFTVIDYNETWLYEAHTGKLIAQLPGYGYYFFNGIRCYGEQIETRDADGKQWMGCVVYDTHTGEELNRVEQIAPAEEDAFLLTDHEGGKLWVLRQHFDPQGEARFTYTACGWFDGDGSYNPTDQLPAAVAAYCQENGAVSYMDNPYVYADGTAFGHYMNEQCQALPPAYQKAYDTFAAMNKTWDPYGFSPSRDGKVALIHYADREEYSGGVAVWSVEDNRLLCLCSGTYYMEKDSGLVYHQLPNRLEVLQIKPDAAGSLIQEPVYKYVSPDGIYGIACYEVLQPDASAQAGQSQYCVGVYSLAQPGVCDFWEFAGIWYTEAGTRAPIFEAPFVRDLLCAAKDCSRIAYISREGMLQVVDIPAGRVAARLDLSDMGIRGLAMNETGTRVAWLELTENGFYVEVVDPDTLECLGTVTYESGDRVLTYGPYLALSGEKLLVAFYDVAFLYDLAQPQAAPKTIDLSHTYGFTDDILFAPSFTADGLLLIPSEEIAAQGVQRRIKGILEPETGRMLDFQSRVTYNREDYYYDERGGNLIQRYSNTFTVQRRGEDGNFAPVYTITPRHNDMQLCAAGHAADGTWLVLQNAQYCEIYRLEDGALCYTLRKTDGCSSQMAVIGGRLYDFCGGWSEGIPLLTVEEARHYVREALVYEGLARTLTEREMAQYYIPGQWREK